MEMDYSLFDGGPGDGGSEAAASLVASDASVEVAEEVVESPPSETPKVEETPQQSVDDFDESTPLTPREKMLMERLERITGENLDLMRKEKPAEQTSVVPPTDRNFLDGLDIDEVLATPENLNKLLLSVYSAAMQEASQRSAEQVLTNLPSIMSQYVAQHLTMTKLVDDFYASNPDLSVAKQTVTAVANRIAAEHPEYTTEQVFTESATEARKILRIRAVTPAPVDKGVKKSHPAFAPTTSGRVREKAPNLTGIEKDVLDLIRN